MPAEWEQQKAVQLTWPHAATDWQYMLSEIDATYVDMAYAITLREHLIIVTPEPQRVTALLKTKLSDDQITKTMLVECDTDDTWARDHGFITLCSDQGYQLLDFQFNGWGKKFEASKDNAINRQLYDKGVVKGEYVSHLDFVLEGGAIESDGQGTVFTTTSCLMAPNRNQPMSQSEIDQRLRESLSAQRIIWLDHGHLVGDDTDGHIDTLVRVAPNDTLLYVACDDANDEQYADLRLMEEQLKALRTTEGQPYRLIKLPMPKAIFDGEERLPATYANFLVVNGAVLYPTYAQPHLDEEARQAISKAFPDREMVGIDCRSIIRQHGSLHCCTMQIYR